MSTERPALDTLIRQALSASPDPDPTVIVEEVLFGIDPVDYPDYLREAITSRLADNVGSLRRSVTPTIRKGVSTKQSLIRDQYWPRFLQQRLFLPSGYKFLGEATADDLRAAASQRQAQAQELLFRAEQFTTLADQMDRAKVVRLEQLDPSLGEKLLERAA